MKWIACFLITGLLVGVTAAWAHSSIKRTSPTDGAQLTKPPKTIEIWFSDPIIPDTGHITLTHSSTARTETLSSRLDETDQTHLIADLPPDLPEDTYLVTISAIATDGHQFSGSFVFWIRPVAERPAPAYGMLLLFAAIFLAGLGGGYIWIRRENHSSGKLDLTQPTEADNHVELP